MSMEFELIELKREIPLSEFVKTCVDIPRFAACCAECPGFGKRWACPPYDFDPADIWSAYSSILLLAEKVVIPEHKRRVDDARAAYEELLKPVKRKLMDELYELEKATPGSLALSAGGCDLCAVCTRPEGKPCRFPEKKRCSIESIGGDVAGCLGKYFGESVLWAENGLLPEHFIIVCALLKK